MKWQRLPTHQISKGISFVVVYPVSPKAQATAYRIGLVGGWRRFCNSDVRDELLRHPFGIAVLFESVHGFALFTVIAEIADRLMRREKRLSE